MIENCLKNAPLRWSLAAVLLAGCGQQEIRTYRVAKEADAAPPQTTAGAASAPPRVVYKTPAGWEEIEHGEMRAASFRVKGKDGKLADVSVIPLPGLAGGDLSNVNRWRGQVGLAAVTQEELAKLAVKITAGGEPADLYDLAGQNPSANTPERILAAIQRRDGIAWFYKMTGDAELVAQQKPAFVEFLQSIHFHAAPSGPVELPPSHPPIDSPPASAPAAGGGANPAWPVPAGWQAQPAGQFQTAKYLATGPADARAEISVSVIPGDGGGALANVNRWRNQIGLGPITEADLPKETSSMEVDGAKAMVLDATSTDKKRRLVAVSVPRANGTWFFKLMGDDTSVTREKEAFLQFARTAK